ncbi:ABC transporter substrate-binding protein [Deltaproteobacteria bacterium TL4]
MFRSFSITGLLMVMGVHSLMGQSILSQPEWIELQSIPTSLFSVPPRHSFFSSEYQESAEEQKKGTASSGGDLSTSDEFSKLLERLNEGDETAWNNIEFYQQKLSLEQSQVLNIKSLYQQKHFFEVEAHAQQFFQLFPDSVYTSQVYYVYNQSLFAQGKLLDKTLTAHEKLFQDVDASLQSSFLRMLSQEAIRQGNRLLAMKYLIEEMQRLTTKHRVIPEDILVLAKGLKTEEELQWLKQSYSHLPFIEAELPYLRVSLLLEQNKISEAAQLIETLLPLTESSEHFEKRELLLTLKKRVQIIQNVNPFKIGVILPISANNKNIAQLSKEALEGIRLSIYKLTQQQTMLRQATDASLPRSAINPQPSELQHSPEPRESGVKIPSFELIVRDSMLSPEKTQEAVRELIEEEHVIAIIGPMLRKTSEAAAEEAQLHHVPLISLSITPSIPDLGNFIFRNNQNWKQEIQTLIQYAVDYRQAERFVILFPKTREGIEKKQLIWEEVERLGKTVHATEPFDLHQKSFVDAFNELTGMNRYVPEDEQEIMTEFEEKQVPIHDFDTLVIVLGTGNVDELKVIFPYSNVYDLKKILFLGDSGWNDPSLIFMGEHEVLRPVFTDSFYKQSSQKEVQEFVTLHEQNFYLFFNYMGPSQYTAFAYDTANILIQLLSDDKNHTHYQLQQALLNMPRYQGVTGKLYFAANGEIQREVQLLTISGIMSKNTRQIRPIN